MECVPALITITCRDGNMLEILAVIKQSLECWKAHQRHTRHLIVDTWLLEKISKKEEKKNSRAKSTKLFTSKYCAKRESS